MEDGSTPFKKYFIGGLSWTTDEESVKAFFEVQGFVVEKTQIMRNKSSGRSRGFGFIMLHSEGPEPLSQYDLDGRQIEVKSAVPKEEMGIRTKKIFVGGLPVQLNQTVFQQHFARYGPIVEAQIMKDRKNSRSRGFGFVRFQSEDTVELVLKDEHFIMGKQVEVKKALPKHALQPKGDQDQDDSGSDEESNPIPTKSSSPTPPTGPVPAPSPPAPAGPAPLPAPNPPPERSEVSHDDKPPVSFNMYPPYHPISSYHHPFVQTAVPHFFGYPPTDFSGSPQVMSHPAYPPVGPFYMDPSFYPPYVPQSTVPRTDQPKSKSPTHEGHHQEGLKGPNNKSNNHSRPNKHSESAQATPKSHIPVHTSVSVPSSSKPSRVAKTHSPFVSITGGKREPPHNQSRPSGIQSRVHGPETTVSAPASPQVMRPTAILSQEPQDHQDQVYLLRNPKSQQADRAPGGPPLFVGYPADDEEDDPEKEPPQLDSGSLFSSSVETLFPLSKSRSCSEKGVLSFDLYGKRRNNSRNVRGAQAGNFSQTF